jgi:hypothetical protein
MADQSLDAQKKLRQAGQGVRKLAERTLKLAMDLPPSDGEQVRKSAVELMNVSERLHALATTTGPGLGGLRSSLGETIENLSTALETLKRIGLKIGDETNEPVN